MEQTAILQAIAEDRAQFRLVPLKAGPVELFVFADALKVDGVRVAVSAATTRKAAVLLGCQQTTPLIEDLIWLAATYRPIPIPFGPPRDSWKTVKAHSAAIDAQLPSQPDPTAIVGNVGKSWVQMQGKDVVNYGWFGGPYAKSPAVTPGLMVIQPPSTAHSDQHWDYSQTLRLMSSRCSVGGRDMAVDTVLRDPVLGHHIAHDSPWSTLPAALPAINLNDPLGVRCVRLSEYEAKHHNPPSQADIVRYFSKCERDGKILGITKGNHCAAFVSWAALQCKQKTEQVPHLPRAAAKELMADAIAAHVWHKASECVAKVWFPQPGDLAIYDRYDPTNPKSQPWYGHVDRVTQVAADRESYENLGANEVPNWTGRGGFRKQWTPFAHKRLLGFVAYPSLKGDAAPPHDDHLLNDAEVEQVRAITALTVGQLEVDFWERWRAT